MLIFKIDFLKFQEIAALLNENILNFHIIVYNTQETLETQIYWNNMALE